MSREFSYADTVYVWYLNEKHTKLEGFIHLSLHPNLLRNIFNAVKLITKITGEIHYYETEWNDEVHFKIHHYFFLCK